MQMPPSSFQPAQQPMPPTIVPESLHHRKRSIETDFNQLNSLADQHLKHQESVRDQVYQELSMAENAFDNQSEKIGEV